MNILRSRTSSHNIRAGSTLTEAEIVDLVQTAVSTPSSFNLQHWRFIAVSDPELKEELRKVSFDQRLVTDSAVTFVVLADLAAHQRAEDILARSVGAGKMPEEVAERWLTMIQERYADNSMEQRDEGIRSASMATMTLMAAVADKGWVSCPMIGFDPVALKKLFSLSENYLPVMLLAVGKEPGRVHAGLERLQPHEVLALNGSASFF